MANHNQQLSDLISDDFLAQCIHCGICLSVCPTYDITKLERSSPRGRIRLIKAFAKNEYTLGKSFNDEMSFCLGCRACETACPAGVQYEHIHSVTKDVLSKGIKFSIQRFVIKFLLNKILAKPSNLKIFSRFLYFYQNSWLRKFLHQSYLLKTISHKLFHLDELTPQISQIPSDAVIQEITSAEINPKYNVAFHVGCIMNVAFANINIDTINLLKKTSCKVNTPQNQYCCGALHAHNGELRTAKLLAKKNIDHFENVDYKYLISNSAGCGSFMKEYKNLFKDDSEYFKRAEIFSSKIKDISEFLVGEKISLNFNKVEGSTTYHDACHHVHGQGIFNQPRQLLMQLNGCEFREMKESTTCCGSAGIYNFTRYKDSMLILDRKMRNIIQANTQVLVTGNPGCLLQLRYGVKKYGLSIDVKHIVSLLNESYTN